VRGLKIGRKEFLFKFFAVFVVVEILETVEKCHKVAVKMVKKIHTHEIKF
jgi:hypothetical protein